MVLFKIYGDIGDADTRKASDIYDADIKKESDIDDTDTRKASDIDDADMVLFRFDDVNSLSDILLSNINDATYNLR